ncbi:hypothetical protein QYE76_061566 [Lolium multiflorum]|uniref:DUF8039 domain-containing protein n=1 Tax=Lolium multiflorum TaxID=4521 RepID=A0AAD8S0Z4_LOLMU|nr:hypothetical protein QYE76_061566 [Lolium multiflorum]
MEEDEEGDDIDAEGGEGEGEGDQEEARDEPVDDLGRTIADARSRCETEKERENLDRMLEDHRKALYPGCDDGLKKLGCTLDLLKWKAQAGVADSAFENLLKMLKNMFPKNNELPASTYEAKKVVCPLGLEVLKIHACINDCILYRGEYENLNECPVCTALRYKIRGDDPGDDVEGQKPRKKVPAKVMWYAPIIPRLKRLFRNKEHAKLLRWHKEDRKSDGELRHPADGTQWRKIDREFKDFAADARNIRFGLSTDGMNPFGEQSSSHSTWPVTLCIYNLPPWLCMKRKFIMMPVLIQGPKQPEKNATKFINQCGAVVRDNVSITVQEWNEPKKARLGFTFVDKRTKKDCLQKLLQHVVLPPEYHKLDEEGNKIAENKKRRKLLKQFALGKMASAFRKFKQNLARDYVNQNKTPDFKGQYEKLKHDWPEFVKQKKSEQFLELSKKIRKMRLRRSTEGWDPRAKSWWYGHGGSLNPETGECVYRGKIIKPTEKLIEAMRDAQEGKIKFNRENDALTKALGNPEHGGRVRGMGHIPWKIGFPQNDDPYGYRSRKRKMDRDADVVARLASEMDVMKKTVSVLVAERDAARAQHEDHPMDLGSQEQRRSSVASTEAPPAGAPTIEITAPEPLVVEITAPEPPRYPVDDIKEMKECHLYYPIGNMSMKVAIASALPCLPGALHHNNPIADGYARVTVEDIVQGFEDLDIDIATPEGARRLGDVKRQFILWQKKFIKFPGEAPRRTSPPPSGGGGGGGGGGSPTPPSRQPTPPPNSPPAGKQTPPPSPRPAGDQTPAPNPPPAKKQRQSWVINPEPYVPATTKIPEPSLKPLTPRPWELSVEENAAVVAAQHEKWQADCKKKREPEPKQVFSEKEKSWAKSFLNTPSQAAKNLPDDYERELRSQALAVGGKQVAQLGEQSKQSIAPLIVKAAGPDDAPDVIAAAAAQGLTVARAKEQAADLGLTLRAALGLDEAPMKDVVFTYVRNGPLVEPAQEEDLPRQMTGSTGFC